MDPTVKKKAHRFNAGAAKVDITPAMGSFVGVDFYNHFARFIYDSLYAKALVFEKEGHLVVFAIIDICIMPSDLMSEIKADIHKETGIRKQNIMLSCTHTHGAGNVAGLLCGGVDIAYRSRLPGLIVQAVILALKNLTPAKIASGSVDVPEHVLCRRYFMKDGYVASNPVTGHEDLVKTNPVGVEHLIDHHASVPDPGVGFLAIKGLDEQWIAILGNYSLHYVGDWHVDSITADYYGEFSRLIQSKLNAGDDFVGMMSYGTGGDVNIWDFMNPDRYPKEHLAKTKLISSDLAQKVFDALGKVQWQENPSLTVQYEELEVLIRKPSSDELKAAVKKIEDRDFDNLKIDSVGMEMIYAREQLLLNEYPNTHTSAVQAIKIGDLGIGALGGELFSETGLWLKDKLSGHNYFTICLANTYDGYIPPAHEMEKGGYETWRARSSFLELEAEQKIRNKLLELVQRII